MNSWLQAFVEGQIAVQVAMDPATAHLLAEAGGMHLYGTVGADVFLRPDGTTVALIEGAYGMPAFWEVDTGSEHIASLVIASKRFPVLARLLPARPETAVDCPSCAAAGRVHGIVCGTCNGLGWNRGQST